MGLDLAQGHADAEADSLQPRLFLGPDTKKGAVPVGVLRAKHGRDLGRGEEAPREPLGPGERTQALHVDAHLGRREGEDHDVARVREVEAHRAPG